MTGCIFLFTGRWAYSCGPGGGGEGGGGLLLGVGGRFMSESLLYGLGQLQCRDYFSGLKPQAVERSVETRTSPYPSFPKRFTFYASINDLRDPLLTVLFLV